MSLSALGAGLSAMQGYQRALDVSANNVANGLTTGYQARQPSFSESAPAGSGVSVSAAPGNGQGTDLTTEMVGQQIYKAGFQASAKVIKTADDMLGSLIDTHA